MKHVLLALALVASVRASAIGVQNLTVHNDTNGKLWCAFIVWDAPASKWVNYSWYAIENGGTGNYVNVAYYHCDEEGGRGRSWGSQRNFCVLRGARHISPYHKADNYTQCLQYGGEWRGFNALPNRQADTLTLNP